MKLTLRKSRPSDWEVYGDRMCSLEQSCLKEIGFFMNKGQIQERILDETAKNVLAFRRESLVGMILSRPLETELEDKFDYEKQHGNSNTLYVATFVTNKQVRRRGIGTKLLKQLMFVAARSRYNRISGHYMHLSMKIPLSLGAEDVAVENNWGNSGLSASYQVLTL